MARDETNTSTAPSHVGRYRLLRKLARGGMAEVFVGRMKGAHGFEKTVAIKRILSKFSDDPQFVRMMVDEAKISVLLNHPNIAQILEFGEENGEYFLVMEYVPGQSLSALVKRLRAAEERMGVLEACFLVTEVLQGLHAAHSQTDSFGRPAGIIHRDVSPQNALISWDGHVKVIDFGIARARDRLEQTQVGTIKGKLRYLAPEMIDPGRFSKTGDFDHRVDVFAAGIILYELVAGRTLFTGADEFEVYDHITKGEIPDLSDENLCDAPLMKIISRGLAKDPEQRYKSAEAFADDLRSYLYRRDPSFTKKRIAALMDLYFAEEKAAAREIEEEAAAAPDEEAREINLTVTAYTPSKARSRESSSRKRKSLTSFEPRVADERSDRRKAPRRSGEGTSLERKTSGSESRPRPGASAADSGRVKGLNPAEADDETRFAPSVASMSNEGTGSVGELYVDPSESLVMQNAQAVASREPYEDTPATSQHEQRDRPRRTAVWVVAASAIIGVGFAIAAVVALERSRDTQPSAVVVKPRDGDPQPTDPPKEPVDDLPTPVATQDEIPVVVSAEPASATIALVDDDREPQASPAVFMLPRGKPAEVRVTAPGYESLREAVPPDEGGEKIRMKVALRPLPVALGVVASPSSAKVTVDGEPYSEGMQVTPGKELSIVARADGYRKLERAALPQVGAPLRVVLKLSKEPERAPRKPPVTRRSGGRGSLTITSTPYWGRVTIDGKVLDDTTPVTVKLSAGMHKIEVAHPPKGIVKTFKVKVPSGGKVRRTVNFNK